MEVVKVDDIRPETPQAGIASAPDILRLGIQTRCFPVPVPDEPELCLHECLVTSSAKGATEKQFVLTRAVFVCGIKQVAAETDGAVYRSDRLRSVSLSAGICETEAAQSKS